jgi:hypothetical protein
MFRYRLHGPDGDDLGEASDAQQIFVGEEIIAGTQPALPRGRRRPVREEDRSPFVELFAGRALLTRCLSATGCSVGLVASGGDFSVVHRCVHHLRFQDRLDAYGRMVEPNRLSHAPLKGAYGIRTRVAGGPAS